MRLPGGFVVKCNLSSHHPHSITTSCSPSGTKPNKEVKQQTKHKILTMLTGKNIGTRKL
jgi:hypothetical protein